MRVPTIVKSFLKDVTPCMHSVRRESLGSVLSSLLSGSDLAVTSLGRNIASGTTEKHQIKRSMRLISNPHLYRDIATIYSAVANRIIAAQMHPVILVDWSDLDPRKQHFLLLIGMLAQYVLFILGVLAKLDNRHRHYQANSKKTASVLSYQFIGLRLYRDRHYTCRKKDWLAACQLLTFQQL